MLWNGRLQLPPGQPGPLYQACQCKRPIVQQGYAFKTALLLAEHLDRAARTVKAIRLDPGGGKDKLAFSDAYGNASEVNQRYLMEDHFIAAIIQGDAEKAREAMDGIGKMSTGVKFISDSFQDHLAASASVRTAVRLAAKRGGLSPVLIDAVSREYAPKNAARRVKKGVGAADHGTGGAVSR